MENVPPQTIFIYTLLAIWQLSIKGLALWRAAKSGHTRWFVALIILVYLNTVGILELVYLFRFAKHPLTLDEVRAWPKKLRSLRKRPSKE